METLQTPHTTENAVMKCCHDLITIINL